MILIDEVLHPCFEHTGGKLASHSFFKIGLVDLDLLGKASNSEKEAIQYIYRQLRNAEPPDDASAREVITNLFFSEKRF